MNGRWFVDTNVLVYARDSTDSIKQARAAEWFSWLWRQRQGRLSVQVLQEYYTTVTRKLRHPISRNTARLHVRSLLAWQPIVLDGSILSAAFRVEDQFGLSWWDSLIVAAAREAQCHFLLTEDLQAGRDLGGVVVVNPFHTSAPQ